MSFNIELMLNDSDVNVVSKRLNLLSTVTGVLKERTSIISPTIKISGNLPVECNYLHIPDFNRYYFINDITSVTADVFEISAHVDVLQTYGDQIKSCEAIISRQENDWNLYLDDGSFKAYQNSKIQKLEFATGFGTPQFVLAVAGS